jgi:hypothetical protein
MSNAYRNQHMNQYPPEISQQFGSVFNYQNYVQQQGVSEIPNKPHPYTPDMAPEQKYLRKKSFEGLINNDKDSDQMYQISESETSTIASKFFVPKSF